MGALPAAGKDRRKKVQVRLFFRLSLSQWEKGVVVSRGKDTRHTKTAEHSGEETRDKMNPAQLQQPHAKEPVPSATARSPTESLGLPDLNMTWDIKSSCKVLMLSQPGRNTRIAPSYGEKRQWREERSEHITHCTESQLLALWYMVGRWDLKPHWPSLVNSRVGFLL